MTTLELLNDPSLPLKASGYVRSALMVPTGQLKVESSRPVIFTERNGNRTKTTPSGVTAPTAIGYIDRRDFKFKDPDWTPSLVIYIYGVMDDYRQNEAALTTFLDAFQDLNTADYAPIFVLKDCSLNFLCEVLTTWNNYLGKESNWYDVGGKPGLSKGAPLASPTVDEDLPGMVKYTHPVEQFIRYLQGSLLPREISYVQSSADKKRKPEMTTYSYQDSSSSLDDLSLLWEPEHFIDDPIQLALSHLPHTQAYKPPGRSPSKKLLAKKPISDKTEAAEDFLELMQCSAAVPDLWEEIEAEADKQYQAIRKYTEWSIASKVAPQNTPESFIRLILQNSQNFKNFLQGAIWAERGMKRYVDLHKPNR